MTAGDMVQLMPRERPYDDNRLWWWRVTNADDMALDAVYEIPRAGATRVVAVRNGVDLRSVRAHRPAGVTT